MQACPVYETESILRNFDKYLSIKCRPQVAFLLNCSHETSSDSQRIPDDALLLVCLSILQPSHWLILTAVLTFKYRRHFFVIAKDVWFTFCDHMYLLRIFLHLTFFIINPVACNYSLASLHKVWNRSFLHVFLNCRIYRHLNI